jgi:hypothetical protein
MKNNNQPNKYSSRGRRGVGGIVAGVILIAILISTVLVYFVMIINNEKAKASYEQLSTQSDQNKAAENLTAIRDHTLTGCPANCHIGVELRNNGSSSVVVTNVLLYCTSAVGCPGANPHETQSSQITPPKTLNAGQIDTITVGNPQFTITNSLIYRVDLLTESGNIVSTTECKVDSAAAICSNDSGGSSGSSTPDFALSVAPSAFSMTPGSIQHTTATVSSLNGFNSAVTLTISPAATFTITPTPPSVTPPAGGFVTSDLTVNAAANTAPGTYLFTVTGTNGAIQRTTQFSVSILPSPQAAVDTGIIQGTGSLKLDFKAFGAIYPDLGSRKGVDQRGWNVQVSSQFSSVTGYPGYDVMLGQNDPHVVFVESARNMDPSGQDLKLSRTTGLLTSSDQIQGTPAKSNFICKGDAANKQFIKYDETTNFTDLPNTPIGSAQTINWQKMYFCTSIPSDGSGGQVPNGNLWIPPTKFSTLNGIFMVARGAFHPVLSEYAQTVPYQAVYYANGGINTCLRSGANNINTACPAPNTTDDVTASLQYSATKAAMKGGTSVWLHIAGANGPYNVSWLYPDGNYTQLINAQNLNANGNIQLTLPRKNTNDNDGNTIDDIDTLCNGIAAGQSRYFTLIVNDTFDANANRSVYNITWGMVC